MTYIHTSQSIAAAIKIFQRWVPAYVNGTEKILEDIEPFQVGVHTQVNCRN
jgi:hypothetical protein